MIDTIRRCLAMLPRGARVRWALLIPIAVVTGLLEAGAAAAVLGLIQIVSTPERATTVPVAATVVRLLPGRDPTTIVLGFTAVVIAYHILKNVVLLAAQYVRHRVSAQTQAELSMTMMRGYLSAPYALLATRNSDELRRNTTAMPGVVCDVLGSLAALLSEWLMAIGLAAVLVRTAPNISLIAGIAVAVLLLATLRWTKALAFRFGRLSHELTVAIDRVVQQAFGTVKELKVLGREPYFVNAYAVHQRATVDVGALRTTLSVVPPLVIETCFVVGALLVIALVTVSGSVGPAALPLLGVSTYAGFRMIPVINRATWRINTIRGNAAAVAHLAREFRAIDAFAASSAAGPNAAAAPGWRELSIDRVSFRYAGAGTDVLREISLRIRRGESLAVVGMTGAGKTTLVDVLLGVLQPSAGRVEVDGIERSSTAVAPRAAYIPQSVFVADDTLARNVAFGVPDAAVDEQRIAAALHTAALDDVARGLPDGLKTMLGERGARLSGGERQRVGIARALYHDPDLLVLDEATSALDSVTEARVLQAIGRMPALCLVVVAHRLSTIRFCDRIAVLVDGRIAAIGSFDELLHANADFRRLVEAAEAAAVEMG